MAFELRTVAVARLVAGLVRSWRCSSRPGLASSRRTSLRTSLTRVALTAVAGVADMALTSLHMTSLYVSSLHVILGRHATMALVTMWAVALTLRLPSGSMRRRVRAALMTLVRRRRPVLAIRTMGRSMLRTMLTRTMLTMMFTLALGNRVRALLLVRVSLAMWTRSLVFRGRPIVSRRGPSLV